MTRPNDENDEPEGFRAGLTFPVECDHVAVTVEHPYVSYDDLDLLIADLRAYLPYADDTQRPDPSMFAPMDTLEHRIRYEIAWDDRRRGTPSEPLSVGPFSHFPGFDVNIEEDEKTPGQLRLRLGRGSVAELAARRGRRVDYTGPVHLTYCAAVPSRPTQMRLTADAAARHSAEAGEMVIPFPLGAVAHHLRDLTEWDESSAEKIELALCAAVSSHRYDDGVLLRDRDVTLRVGGHGSKRYRSRPGDAATAMVPLYRAGQGYEFAGPALGVTLQHADPQRHSELARALISAATEQRLHPHPGGHRRIHPNRFSVSDAVAARLGVPPRRQPAPAPTAPASPEPSPSPPSSPRPTPGNMPKQRPTTRRRA